jgi:queuine/archaeosine tRNA-ribosyltransferase
LIAQDINSKFDSPIKIIATQQQIEQIIETCINWLNNENTKVASKAHAMEALYFLGIQNKWIHYELKMILEKNIPNESPAYGTRGTKILELMAKNDLA